VQGDSEATLGGEQQGDTADLGCAHDRANVVLREDALDRHELWLMPVKHVFDAPAKQQETLL
jgi:hypothetical protein